MAAITHKCNYPYNFCNQCFSTELIAIQPSVTILGLVNCTISAICFIGVVSQKWWWPQTDGVLGVWFLCGDEIHLLTLSVLNEHLLVTKLTLYWFNIFKSAVAALRGRVDFIKSKVCLRILKQKLQCRVFVSYCSRCSVYHIKSTLLFRSIRRCSFFIVVVLYTEM